MVLESLCLKTAKSNGQRAIVLAMNMRIIDEKLEIKSDDNFIYIPLIGKPYRDDKNMFRELPEYAISTSFFESKRSGPRSYLELLEKRFPPSAFASLPRSMDFIGDIATIELPAGLEGYEEAIGNAILKAHKNARVVLAKAGAVKGTYRLRKLRFIAGDDRTETLYKEHGCQYYVDLAKVYISPRLSNEHLRVASQVKEGETVIDMFAGVGPFSVLIAKTHENVKVYAIDVNPLAVEFLRRNVRLNRVENKVHPLLGDAKEILQNSFSSSVDRVIMNLPERAIEYVAVACKALKSIGGTIHFYSFVNARDSAQGAVDLLAEAVIRTERKIKDVVFSKKVRETAPYEWQVVVDAEIG